MSSSTSYGLSSFKRGLLLFWSIWFTLVCLTNFFDYLAHLHALPEFWRLRSNNYAMILSVINIYNLGHQSAAFLFISDIIFQSFIAVLFFIATFSYRRTNKAWRWINRAFIFSIALWAIFIFMDEIFIAYNFAGTHTSLFMMELLSFLALHLLPE